MPSLKITIEDSKEYLRGRGIEDTENLSKLLYDFSKVIINPERDKFAFYAFKLGIAHRKRFKSVHAAINSLYHDKQDTMAVGKMFEMERNGICLILNRLGHKLKQKGGSKKRIFEKKTLNILKENADNRGISIEKLIKEAFQTYKSYAKVGKFLGVSHMTAFNHAKRLGIR